MIVLDTNVVSEPAQQVPSEAVLRWLKRQDPAELFTTAITEAEVFYGLSLLAPGKRREGLENFMLRFFSNLASGHILAFDRLAAREFAAIAASRRKAGQIVGLFDIQIAAIARANQAAIATRDTRDFEGTGVTIINPWTA